MFRVLFTRTGDADLFAQMVRSANKPAVFQSARTAERLLKARPHEVGEGRGVNERVLIVRPLLFGFSIDDAERVVYIRTVRWVGF